MKEELKLCPLLVGGMTEIPGSAIPANSPGNRATAKSLDRSCFRTRRSGISGSGRDTENDISKSNVLNAIKGVLNKM